MHDHCRGSAGKSVETRSQQGSHLFEPAFDAVAPRPNDDGIMGGRRTGGM